MIDFEFERRGELNTAEVRKLISAACKEACRDAAPMQYPGAATHGPAFQAAAKLGGERSFEPERVSLKRRWKRKRHGLKRSVHTSHPISQRHSRAPRGALCTACAGKA